MILTHLLLPLLALCIPSCQSSIPQQEKQDQENNANLTPTKSLNKRYQQPVAFPTLHATGTDGAVYQVDVALGTPPQGFGLRVDIAQPYVWVLDADYYQKCPDASNYSSKCEVAGAYSINDSSSGIVTNEEESYTFADLVQINGSVVQEDVLQMLNISTNGYEYTDQLSYYNSNFHNQHSNYNISLPRFISAKYANLNVGAFGLAGPNTDDSYSANNNMLKSMRLDQFINSSSFSMYAKDEYNLDIIFGGVNQSLYFEPLVKFDKIPFLDQLSNTKRDTIRYNYPIVPLSNIFVNNAKGSSISVLSPDQSSNVTIIPTLLDTRASFSYLPYNTLIKLAIQLNAFYSSQSASWFVKCSVGNLGASLGFQFGNLRINVPVSNFLVKVFQDESENSTVTFDDGSDACLLTFKPNNRFGYSILGTNFLQAAYLVVDNDNDQVALAQANNKIYSGLNNTYLSKDPITTTQGFSSSIIRFDSASGIPFVQGNNLTDFIRSVTFTSKSSSASEVSTYPAEVSALYSSGRIFTGDTNTIRSLFTAMNSGNPADTTTSSALSTTNTPGKFSALAGLNTVDRAVFLGGFASLFLIVTSLVL